MYEYVEDEEGNKKSVPADQDFSDEFQIKCSISEFYQVANTINNDNAQDSILKLKARRNVIINMTHVYLSKFNNKPIMDDFIKALAAAKKDAEKDGKRYKYRQFLNEIRTVGTFLGIRESLSDKLAEQLLDGMVVEDESQKNPDTSEEL